MKCFPQRYLDNRLSRVSLMQETAEYEQQPSNKIRDLDNFPLIQEAI